MDDKLVNSYTAYINENESLSTRIEVVRRKLRSNRRKGKRRPYHKESYRRIVKYYFGYQVVIDRVVHKKHETAKFPTENFHCRFRMSANLV